MTLFSKASRVVKRPTPLFAQCGACGLYKTCKSPQMPCDGEGGKKILVVGEFPAEKDDAQGKPFRDAAGDYLTKTFRKYGVDLRRDCWLTNALACRPPQGEISDDRQIEHCRPNVANLVREKNPEKILLLGSAAAKSVLGWLWRPDDVGGVFRWAGYQVPDRKTNAYLAVTFHPDFILSAKEPAVAALLFEEHVRAFAALEGRPYQSVPDFSRQLKLVYDDRDAADRVHRFIDAGVPVAFDLETDRLKPDHPDATILSCAVSDGAVSVAFPWRGAAVKAMKELLLSPLLKIGQSIKFEHRWCLERLGVRVRNWRWDGLLVQHALDNRKGVTGLEFMAYALLGVPPWDAEVAKFMTSDATGKNRLHEVPVGELLKYNATDSLLEHAVASFQAKKLGVVL